MIMKTMKKTLMVFVIALLVCVGYGVISNNYAYAEVQSGTWHSGYDGSTTWEFDCDTQTLTISGNGELWYEQPAEVIEINEVYGIKHVILGEGITSVSGFCNGFDKLIDVMLPDSLLSIGGNSFFHCAKLESIAIPESVTSIGAYAFCGCNSLASVTVPVGVTSIETGTFSESSMLEEVVLPNTVRAIGSHAFYKCPALTSVAIPDGVRIIQNMTFYGCSSLETLVIPDSVLTIKDDAFCYCSSLKSLVFPDNMNPIEQLSLVGCSSLEEIALPGTQNVIVDKAFKDCTSLKRIYIPETVTSIGEYAFDHCTSLEEIDIPDAVTSIGEYAFYYCSNLTVIELPNGISSIGTCTFAGCKKLETVQIPSGVETIGASAFAGCEMLSDVSLPSNLTRIEQKAFRNCAFEEIIIPEGLSILHAGNGTGGVFSECKNLRKVTLPSSLQKFSLGTFSGCNNLRELDIPASVTTLLDGISSEGNKHLKRIIFHSEQAPQGYNSLSYAGDLVVANPYFRICVPNEGTGYEFELSWSLLSENVIHCSSATRNNATVLNGVLDDGFDDNSMDHYYAGEPVHIEAVVPEDKKFGHWEITKGVIEDLDVEAEAADFTMPAEEVEITAVFYDKQRVTVNGGTADAENHFPGDSVQLTAQVPDGKAFKCWRVDSGTINDLNAAQSNTTFTMPNEPVELTAEFYDKHHVNISNGTASPNFCAVGERVTITANAPEGKAFVSWSVTGNTVDLDDANAEQTTFLMPDEDVEITANLGNTHTVSIAGGRINSGEKGESATIPVGQTVTIAAAPPTGKVFKEWKLVAGTAEGMDQTQILTSFTMPDEDVSVKAVFENQAAVGEDRIAPVVTDIRVKNPRISKPGVMNIDLDIIEEDSGTQNIIVTASFEDGNSNYDLIGYIGDDQTYYTGTVPIQIQIPTTARNGKFTITSVSISDKNNNSRSCWVDKKSDVWYLAYDDSESPVYGPVNYDYELSTLPEFTVYYEFDISVDTAISNPNVVNRIRNMEDGGVARLRIDSNGILKKEVLDAIKGTNKILVLYKDAYQWIIRGNLITGTTKDIDVNLGISKKSGRDYCSARDIIELNFAANGQLPAISEIRLKSDYLYSLYGITGNLFLYYYSNGGISQEGTAFNLVFDGTDKWCNFTVSHNSKFFVSGVKLKKPAAQPMKVTAAKKTLKVKKLKKKAQTIKPLTIRGAKGKVTYKLVGGNAKSKKALKFNKKTGKVTVKKKTKKGTYKIKVRVNAAGNLYYKSGYKNVWITVKVK